MLFISDGQQMCRKLKITSEEFNILMTKNDNQLLRLKGALTINQAHISSHFLLPKCKTPPIYETIGP